jgi:hypothetical protein
MGTHEGKPADDEEFAPSELTPAQLDGDAPPGKHEKPATK